MNPFIKPLRRLVPEEIKALLEKIDSIDDAFDSSYYTLQEYVRHAKLTRLERFLLRNAMCRIDRHTAMVNAMNIVINSRKPDPRDVFTTAGTAALSGSLYTGSLYGSANGISVSELNTQMQLKIYEEAEKARQAELDAQKMDRKKVVIRRRPAGA